MAKKKNIVKRMKKKVDSINKKARKKVLDVIDVSHPEYAAILRADFKKKKRK